MQDIAVAHEMDRKWTTGTTTRELNRRIQLDLKTNDPVEFEINGQDSIAVGLDTDAAILASGNAGDFFGALNNGADIRLSGNSGRFVGDVMRSGTIVVEGNCGEGPGMYMYGGLLVVEGSAGNNMGQISKGGIIFIKGNAGDNAGLYLTGGDIVVLGDIGRNTGEWMIKGRIFVAGDIGGLGNNAVIGPLDGEDERFLMGLFSKTGVKTPLEKFKKVAPKELRPFYKK